MEKLWYPPPDQGVPAELGKLNMKWLIQDDYEFMNVFQVHSNFNLRDFLTWRL